MPVNNLNNVNNSNNFNNFNNSAIFPHRRSFFPRRYPRYFRGLYAPFAYSSSYIPWSDQNWICNDFPNTDLCLDPTLYTDTGNTQYGYPTSTDLDSLEGYRQQLVDAESKAQAAYNAALLGGDRTTIEEKYAQLNSIEDRLEGVNERLYGINAPKNAKQNAVAKSSTTDGVIVDRYYTDPDDSPTE